MVKGQKIINAVCRCGETLPVCFDNGVWDLVSCKNCGRSYNVSNLLYHGGKIIDPEWWTTKGY